MDLFVLSTWIVSTGKSSSIECAANKDPILKLSQIESSCAYDQILCYLYTSHYERSNKSVLKLAFL